MGWAQRGLYCHHLPRGIVFSPRLFWVRPIKRKESTKKRFLAWGQQCITNLVTDLSHPSRALSCVLLQTLSFMIVSVKSYLSCSALDLFCNGCPLCIAGAAVHQGRSHPCVCSAAGTCSTTHVGSETEGRTGWGFQLGTGLGCPTCQCCLLVDNLCGRNLPQLN